MDGRDGFTQERRQPFETIDDWIDSVPSTVNQSRGNTGEMSSWSNSGGAFGQLDREPKNAHVVNPSTAILGTPYTISNYEGPIAPHRNMHTATNVSLELAAQPPSISTATYSYGDYSLTAIWPKSTVDPNSVPACDMESALKCDYCPYLLYSVFTSSPLPQHPLVYAASLLPLHFLPTNPDSSGKLIHERIMQFCNRTHACRGRVSAPR